MARQPKITGTDAWDPLHTVADPATYWTTDNVGEAIPGVLTPLNWTFWRSAEKMTREVGFQMGAFSRAERVVPRDQADWFLTVFYGRAATRIAYLASIGDRMPGTSGDAVVEAIVGEVPEGFVSHPTRARYPIIAWRFPYSFLRLPHIVRGLAKETDQWWRSEVVRIPTLDESAAREAFREAERRFEKTLISHSVCVFAVVQPLYGAVCKLVERTGRGDVGALSGSGGAEMAMIEDIWRASRGEISVPDVAHNHGFHGPAEGEISSHVWRDDPTPLHRIVKEYATRRDAADPIRRHQDEMRRCRISQNEVLAALPRIQRPVARQLLRLAAARIPLRGLGKQSFLQSLDVGRMAARRLGETLAEREAIDDPEDVFYLAFDELAGVLPDNARELIARRRERRAAYQALSLPASWQGAAPTTAPAAAEGQTSRASTIIEGLGASAGVVEGVVRVVLDPSFQEVEPDEILVAPMTDPSWASIMFVSAALVVDLGGTISHAAVVARELGLPCVVNTRVGTKVLRTGDRVRVDGTAGTVTVLAPAATTSNRRETAD